MHENNVHIKIINFPELYRMEFGVGSLVKQRLHIGNGIKTEINKKLYQTVLHYDYNIILNLFQLDLIFQPEKGKF